MVCPYCKITPLIVQNNNYYCPSCRIYIGSATGAKFRLNPAQTPANNIAVESGSAPKTQNSSRRSGLGGLIFKAILFLTIAGIYFFFASHDSYLDLLNGCNIKIEASSIQTNKALIQSALNTIKKNKIEGYKDICRFIDTIGEQSCPVRDYGPGNRKSSYYCYVKGSKTVYISPKLSETPSYIDNIQQAELLLKLAGFSKDFWQNSR